MGTGALLSRGGDVFGASRLEEILRPGDFIGSVTVHRKQYTTRFYSTLIALRFVFRHAHSDHGADKSTDCSTRADSSQRSHDRTGGDERSHARDRQRANSRQKAESAANYTARSHSGGGAFGSFGVFLVSELLSTLIIR